MSLCPINEEETKEEITKDLRVNYIERQKKSLAKGVQPMPKKMRSFGSGKDTTLNLSYSSETVSINGPQWISQTIKQPDPMDSIIFHSIIGPISIPNVSL